MSGVWLLSDLCYYGFKCAMKAGGLQLPRISQRSAAGRGFQSTLQRQANRTAAVGPVFSGVCFCFSCRSKDEKTEGRGDAGSAAPGDPVVCEAEDSFTCSVALDDPATFAMLVGVSVSGAVAPSVLLTIPARPGEWQDSLPPLVWKKFGPLPRGHMT